MRAEQADQPVAPGTEAGPGRRDRVLALVALAVLTGTAWAILGLMVGTGDAATPFGEGSWGLAEAFGLFVMWLVMMTAMMVPSATPIFLLYLAILRRRHGTAPLRHGSAFVAGYLTAWAGFGALATGAQYALHAAALLSADAMRIAPPLAGILLLAAGVWQWTPLKRACLLHCRSPLHFFTVAWREGARGAFTMGARHGLWCVGCCWMLMTLLFVAGVMNLLWIAALSALVLMEKVAPEGLRLGRAWGLLLVTAGVWLLLR